MSQQAMAGSRTNAWLLARSGPLAGTRFPMPDGTTRIGRAPDNDVVIDGDDCTTVSLYHAEISRDKESCRVRDVGSTNGTWVDGSRIAEAEVSPPVVIQLGSQGPKFALVLEDAAPGQLDRTIEIPLDIASQIAVPPAAPLSAHEELLSSAVTRARRMRAHGLGGQTMTIMRGAIDQALRQTRRRFRIIGYSLVAALVVVSSLAIWKITVLNREKRAIDAHIQQIEAELEKPAAGTDTDLLLTQLNLYQSQAETLQRTLLYRVGGMHNEGDYVTRELRSVMAEFAQKLTAFRRNSPIV